MVTLGILFFEALNSSRSAQAIFPIPQDQVRSVPGAFLPFPGWEAVSTWERKAGSHSQSPDSGGRHPPSSVCFCSSSLFRRLTSDLAFASFSVHHCENFLGSLSIFPLLLSQALINLFGASPGTPSNSYKSKGSS